MCHICSPFVRNTPFVSFIQSVYVYGKIFAFSLNAFVRVCTLFLVVFFVCRSCCENECLSLKYCKEKSLSVKIHSLLSHDIVSVDIKSHRFQRNNFEHNRPEEGKVYK